MSRVCNPNLKPYFLGRSETKAPLCCSNISLKKSEVLNSFPRRNTSARPEKKKDQRPVAFFFFCFFSSFFSSSLFVPASFLPFNSSQPFRLFHSFGGLIMTSIKTFLFPLLLLLRTKGGGGDKRGGGSGTPIPNPLSLSVHSPRVRLRPP